MSKQSLLKVVLGVFLFGIYSCGNLNGQTGSTDLQAAVKDGALLVDVRTPEEYASGHVEGSVNIPLGELSERLDELKSKDQSIVVFCQSGGRSAQAKKLLEEKGYAAVVNGGGWANVKAAVDQHK